MSKVFFVKIFVLSICTLIPFLIIQYQICTKYDRFYWATTTPQSTNSLIVGTSTAREGIVPQILKQEINLSIEPQNIALTGNESPYGSYYYSFIRRKKLQKNNRGLHIIEVNPISIMNYNSEIGTTREKEQLHYKLHQVNASVNWEYMLRFYPESNSYLHYLYQIVLKNRIEGNISKIHHPNGWSEIKEKVISNSPRIFKKLPNCCIENKERELYLKRTIDYLSKSGKVFLVRMPVLQKSDVEGTEIHSSFDSLMTTLAYENDAAYLNYTNDGSLYHYYDNLANHLESESAKKFTKKLSEDINQHLNIN